MTYDLFDIQPLPSATFGIEIRFNQNIDQTITQLEQDPNCLLEAYYDAHGLAVIKNLHKITHDPSLLVRLSYLFGPEVENYRETPTPDRLIHSNMPQIIVLSNLPPMKFPVPELPDPPRTKDGKVPVQFPHRKGWHTDQSFRRPPPDISLFYAMQPCPKGQGQTLYADGTSAYADLALKQKNRIQELDAIHVIPWTGRSEESVRAGEQPTPLAPHQAPQRQPIVREHPITESPALYLCENEQLDWILGPVAGLSPGPDGDGANLIYELMTHYTQPKFTYVHDWDEGDLVIHDNRNLIHSATWFDSELHGRIMWRTTVTGNPGSLYENEQPSWQPLKGEDPMGELDYAIP